MNPYKGGLQPGDGHRARAWELGRESVLNELESDAVIEAVAAGLSLRLVPDDTRFSELPTAAARNCVAAAVRVLRDAA